MFANKPIIGIAGGIGSGKSYVASLFGEMGCLVIRSDDAVRDAYRTTEVKDALRAWWGGSVFDAAGEVDKRAVADRIFAETCERERLEHLLHPLVARVRQRAMQAMADDAQVKAYVWDTPLLFETGLNRQCDAVVFVDVPFEVRLERVRKTRGWSQDQLLSRENSQWPLDKKRRLSDNVIDNTADADQASASIRSQLREVLSRILAKTTGEADAARRG